MWRSRINNIISIRSARIINRNRMCIRVRTRRISVRSTRRTIIPSSPGSTISTSITSATSSIIRYYYYSSYTS